MNDILSVVAGDVVKVTDLVLESWPVAYYVAVANAQNGDRVDLRLMHVECVSSGQSEDRGCWVESWPVARSNIRSRNYNIGYKFELVRYQHESIE